MLTMIVIGWVVVLPMIVIVGLYVASKLLGARARRTGAIDITGLAREFPDLPGLDSADPQPAEVRETVGSAY